MAEKMGATPSGPSPAPDRESTRAQERYLLPPVDIYETPEGLVLLADLPGVLKEDLNVRVDNNMLTIQGRTQHALPSEPLYREFDLVNFFRQFELSEEVEQAKISAQLKETAYPSPKNFTFFLGVAASS